MGCPKVHTDQEIAAHSHECRYCQAQLINMLWPIAKNIVPDSRVNCYFCGGSHTVEKVRECQEKAFAKASEKPGT